MRPAELHAEVLAALGRAGSAVADATAPPWQVGDPPGLRTDFVLSGRQDGRRVAELLSRWDAHLIVAAVNNASSAYRGARRIIERHAPMESGACDTCWGHLYADAAWPCDDYRDAALVIPNLPPEVTRALRS